MSNSTAAQLACDALRALLLAALPAAVAAKNLGRAASLTTPAVGPFTIPADGVLRVTFDGTTFTDVALTSGSRTAAELVTEINTACGAAVAAATADGRLRIFSVTPPSSPTTNSVVGLGADTTGVLEALGFDPSGESVVRAPLVAPTNAGVMDGEPTLLPPMANGRMICVIGDREDAEIQLRRDEREATMELRVYVPLATQDGTREEIQSACACLLNVLSTTSGRQFARTPENDIGFTRVKSVKVSGSRWKVPNDLSYHLDQARFVITARVFQQTALT